MKLYKLFVFIVAIQLFSSCKHSVISEVASPNGNIKVVFQLDNIGTPTYKVIYEGNDVIATSKLGFEFTNSPTLTENLSIENTFTNSFDETWEMPWGEQQFVENKYNELTIQLVEKNELNRKVSVVFKVYDDGVGFRYEFPEQENLKEVLIKDEVTEFNLTGNHKVWWIPGDWDIYEHLYNTTLFSKINALEKANHSNLAQTYIPVNAVNTPVTMKTSDSIYISFHEAALVDYAGMTIQVDTTNFSMKSNLVGSDNHDYKVKKETPFVTPWRTIQIAENAGKLIESKLIVNLNEPNALEDISWFTPTKYTGIWWEMHLGKSTWDMASGKHGATSENAKKLIDFSSKNNINAMLVEGWNVGWEHWIGFEDREGVFDFVTPYADYNLEEIVLYGKEKGVNVIMHHETSAATETYTKQQDTAFALMQKLGLHAVKTGYVGKILPKGEYHHGQYMVNHYNNTVEKAAIYKVAVNAHEPIKATGLRRTYPNTISREGLRGQEFNAWSSEGGNPPEHLSIVAFTRMLAGPIDYTPGIFDIKFDKYKENNQVNSTLAHQLALYVVIYSPVQMVPDLIENYENQPAFQFIKDVVVDWQETKVLNGEVGDFVTIARKDRNSENWFVGGITDENGRDVTLDFSFLDQTKKYKATIYKDGENAHWDTNPTEILIVEQVVTNQSKVNIKLAPGGGFAITLIPEIN